MTLSDSCPTLYCGVASPLVRPVVTPRFVPTCSRPLLEGLAALAARQGLHIQVLYCSVL